MANLLGWLGKEVAAPIRRDVFNPIGHLVSQGENTVAAAGAGVGGLARATAGAVTHNPVAEQNALNQTNQAINNRLALNHAFLTAQQAHQGGTALIKPTLSAAGQIAPFALGPELKGATALGSILRPAAAFGGLGAATTAVQGGNRNQIIKSGLTNAAAGGIGGGIGVGVRGAPAVARAVNDIPKNEVGAVGKNVNLTNQELTAGKALGLTQKQILQAKNTTGLDVAFKNITARTSPGELASMKPKEQMAVTNILSKMPTKTRQMPVAPKGIGDLPPVQDLPAANKLFSSKVNALRKIGTQSSNALADKIGNIEADSRSLRANWMSKIPTVQKLNHGDTQNLFNVVENKAKPNNPQVAQAAKEWRALTPQIHSTGQNEGLLVGERQNYIPHNYDMNKIAKNKSAYDSAIQHLIDTNQTDHQTAVNMFADMKAEAARFPSRFGNFESARLTDMPGFDKSKQTLYNYVGGAANRIAQARHFGTDNEVANKLLDLTRMEGGDVTSASHAVANYIRSSDRGTGAGTLRAVRGGLGAARLSKAAISHAGQSSNTAVDTGIGNTVKNWGRYLGTVKGKQNAEFIRKTGVTNPQEIHAYQNQFTSVKGAMSKVTAPGLNQIMKVNRSVTALAYREYGNALAKGGKEADLRQLGVTGPIGQKLTSSQELQAARGGVDRTMFNPSRATTPIYAETKTGKLVGQYRTAYQYKQTGFIYNRIIKEAGNGNIQPLVRYLAVSAPIGLGTVAIKNKISGSKEGPGGRALDVAGALGGLPGEAAVQLARYGKKDLPGTIADLAAPAAGEVVKAGEAINKGKKEALGYAAGLVPAVGNRLSHAVYGTSKKQQAQNKATTQNLQTETQFRATKPQGQTLQQVINSKGEKTYAYSLSDGSIATSKDKKTAQTAIQKDTFTQSGQNFQQLGKNIWQLDSNGNPTHTTVPVYQYSVNSATLTSQKDAGDIQGWLSTANKQLQNIQGQLKDPSTSPLKALQLQNDASTLQSNIAKYTGYGGFTKPKSGKSTIASRRSASAKAISSFKVSAAKAVPKPKGVSVRKLAAPSFKAPKTAKLSVSRIPVVSNRRKA